MASSDSVRGGDNIIERFINFTGSRMAKVVAAIPYNSSEAELFTAANPGDVDVTSTTAPAGKAAASGNVHEPAANTAAVITKAAGGAGVSNVLGLVAWSYDLTPTAGSLIIEDGAGTTVFKIDLPDKGAGFLPFNPGLKGTANTAMVITLAAGGAGVSGVVSVHAWTE